MAGSATRKARATSSVVSPPSRRRVRATCASVASAGLQHVKMRRSRSSCTLPITSGPGSSVLEESIATSSSNSRRRVSRRRRSMAHLRAVGMIQRPGLGGRPSTGHLRRATANASCTASSATSMSPKTRIRVATHRPDSSRKMGSIAAASIAGEPPTPGASGVGLLPERSDLDRSADRGAGIRRPYERCVEIMCLDDVEAPQVFLGLGERAVGGHDIAVCHADDRSSVGIIQFAGEDQGASRLHLLLENQDLLPPLLHLFFGHLGEGCTLDATGGEHVLVHRLPLRLGRAGPTSHPNYELASPIL